MFHGFSCYSTQFFMCQRKKTWAVDLINCKKDCSLTEEHLRSFRHVKDFKEFLGLLDPSKNVFWVLGGYSTTLTGKCVEVPKTNAIVFYLEYFREESNALLVKVVRNKNF